jgi:glycosyltransferase involved in cell wall biosynthesis
MLVAQVGPYPPGKNGIGDYVVALAGALHEADPDVACLVLACRAPGAPEREPGVWRCFEPRSDWTARLLAAVDEVRPRLVHVQHGMYLGHDGRLPLFLEGLRARGVPGVVTLHGVWPASLVRRWPRRFHRALGRAAGRVVIHQRAGSMDVLLGHGVPSDRISVIPHWTKPAPAVDPVQARLRLGLGGGPLALFAGLIFPRKGLHVAVRAFPAVARGVPGARLLAMGRVRTASPVDWVYRAWLGWLAGPGRRAGWLDYRPGHASEEDLEASIAAADAVVFPYLRPYGSSSGMLHRVLAAGRPVVCSNVPTFAEAIDAWGRELPELVVRPGDVGAWERAMADVLGRADLRAQAAGASARLGNAFPLAAAAEAHVRLYRELLGTAP